MLFSINLSISSLKPVNLKLVELLFEMLAQLRKKIWLLVFKNQIRIFFFKVVFIKQIISIRNTKKVFEMDFDSSLLKIHFVSVFCSRTEKKVSKRIWAIKLFLHDYDIKKFIRELKIFFEKKIFFADPTLIFNIKVIFAVILTAFGASRGRI